jgi:hypothetical protein
MTSTEIRSLQSLIQLINRKGSIEDTYPELHVEDSKIGQFVRRLLNDGFASDSEAAKHLYGRKDISGSYRTLKYRVLTRALNHLHCMNIGDLGLSSYASSHLQRLRDNYVSTLLLRKANRAIATNIALKQISKARKDQDTLSELFYSMTILTSLSRESSTAQFMHYYNSIEQLLKRFVNEVMTELYLDRLNVVETDEHNTEKKYLILSKFSEDSARFVKETPSHNLYLNHYRILSALAQLMHNSNAIIDMTENVQEYLAANHRFYQPSRVGETALAKSRAMLEVRDFESACKESENSLNSFITEGHNWFLAMEHSLVLAFMSQNYEKVFSLLSTVFSSLYISLHSPYLYQRFLLLYGYAVLLNKIGLYNQDISGSYHRTTFRMSSLINSLPRLFNEKDESNFQIIAMSLIHSAVVADYDSITDRMPTLRVYICRYLRSTFFNRDRLFIRTFTALSNSSFDPRTFRKKYGHLVEQLREPVPVGTPTSMNELIPYHTVFDRLLAMIEERGY